MTDVSDHLLAAGFKHFLPDDKSFEWRHFACTLDFVAVDRFLQSLEIAFRHAERWGRNGVYQSGLCTPVLHRDGGGHGFAQHVKGIGNRGGSSFLEGDGFSSVAAFAGGGV